LATPPPSAAANEAYDETADLVRRAQGGDLAAFNLLVVRHQSAAYSLALRFLRSREAAEDVTQEAFFRAYRALDGFRGERFRAWLLRIVANAARDELRRRKRRPQRSLDEARDDPDTPDLDPLERGPGPEQVAENADLRRVLEAALARLPEEWRMVVLLSDVHGLSYEEVATSVGVPVGTVKSRLSRARGRLREILRESGELPGRPERQPL
jgi:RNA polymerase sigma-70 factor (ECF subfamily)